MKCAIVFLALVGYAYCGGVGYAGYAAVPAVGILNTGSSAQFRSQDNIGNYAFGYNEDHATGGTFRREQGGPGVQVGSYGLRDADGRVRVVNYVADGAGFRANIQTNEPGVEPKDPAAVLINKAAAIVAAPAAVAVAAPLAAHGVAYGAPYGIGPVASYSTVTQHVAAAPAVVAHAAPVVAHAAYGAPLAAPLAGPIGYATKTVHGW